MEGQHKVMEVDNLSTLCFVHLGTAGVFILHGYDPKRYMLILE